MEYNQDLEVLKKARELFGPIPEDQWITGRFTDESNSCCAVGHWVRLTGDNPSDYITWNCDDLDRRNRRRRALRDASQRVASAMGTYEDISVINNYSTPKYRRPTPKQRVTAFLDDAINFLEKGSIANG
jgi:hypothetical protein